MEFYKASLFCAACFLFLFLIVLCEDAHAYLDPGSGSYVLQLILAGLLAASFSLKSLWKNGLTFFANLFSRKKKGKKASS